MLFRRVTSICVFSLILSLSLFAQGDRGTITGTVTDSTGAPMPNVAVSITNTATNTSVRVTTTGTGEYNVSSLQPGPYRVEIVAPGFKRYVQAGIQAAAGSSVRLDAKLEIGQVTESVEVRAQSVQLQTENAKVTAPVENKTDRRAAAGSRRRDAQSVRPGHDDSASRGSGNSLIDRRRAGGCLGRHARRAFGEHQPCRRRRRDGVPDTVGRSHHRIRGRDQRLQSRVRTGGGGMITFASKSGTNAFHGTAYDFRAQRPFRRARLFRHERSVYKQNDFGASAGGPVRIPKLYNGSDQTSSSSPTKASAIASASTAASLSVPTPEMYKGDFSKWVDSRGASACRSTTPPPRRPNPAGGFIRDAVRRQQIPQNRFSTVASRSFPSPPAVTPNRAGWFRNSG